MLRGCYGGDRDGIRPCLRSQHVRLGMIVMWGAIVGIYWIREETFLAATALLDNAFNAIPAAIATGSTLDDIASDFPSSTGDTGPGSSSFRGFARATGFHRRG